MSTSSNRLEQALDRAEHSLRNLAAGCRFQSTSHPNVFCTSLPKHWRSNKSLPTPFVIMALQPVEDGTKVSVAAGNEENCTADIKNNSAEFDSQIARFSDLRFVGKSGRGKNFNLTITLHTNPSSQVVIVSNAIKVTVDGPRDSRNAMSKCLQGELLRKRSLAASSLLLTQLPSSSQQQQNMADHFSKRRRYNLPISQSATIAASPKAPKYISPPLLSSSSSLCDLLNVYMSQACGKAEGLSTPSFGLPPYLGVLAAAAAAMGPPLLPMPSQQRSPPAGGIFPPLLPFLTATNLLTAKEAEHGKALSNSCSEVPPPPRSEDTRSRKGSPAAALWRPYHSPVSHLPSSPSSESATTR